MNKYDEQSDVERNIPRKRFRRVSITGVGTSRSSALAWIASICGCRYDREAMACVQLYGLRDGARRYTDTYLKGRIHETVGPRNVYEPRIVAIVEVLLRVYKYYD